MFTPSCPWTRLTAAEVKWCSKSCTLYKSPCMLSELASDLPSSPAALCPWHPASPYQGEGALRATCKLQQKRPSPARATLLMSPPKFAQCTLFTDQSRSLGDQSKTHWSWWKFSPEFQQALNHVLLTVSHPSHKSHRDKRGRIYFMQSSVSLPLRKQWSEGWLCYNRSV